MENNIKLLYAEDQGSVREGYMTFFSKYFETIHEATNGQEAWDLYKEHRPELIILDVNMPIISGLELANMIREIDEKCKIIMLTAYSDVDKLLKAVTLNLTDYIVKPAKKIDLEKAITKSIDEISFCTTNVVKLRYGYTWDKNEHKLLKRNKEIKLTKKEIMLFNLLTSNPKSSFSNDDIMNFLYDYESNDVVHDTSKLRTLLYRLKTKLDKELIESIYGVGYKIKLPT